jgi:hypothetical protein
MLLPPNLVWLRFVIVLSQLLHKPCMQLLHNVCLTGHLLAELPCEPWAVQILQLLHLL